MKLFKVTKRTHLIQLVIIATIKANGKQPTIANVKWVWSNYMVQNGLEIDVCDAMACVFGGQTEDYDFAE